jgi:Rieske 2Fe-2S family protein
LNAFHNTCRHRGSLLCLNESGRFRNGRIVCPYHAWVYSLDGELQRTPRRVETDDFNTGDYPLYKVALEIRAGFVFINLAEAPGKPFAPALAEEMELIADWPLAELGLAYQQKQQIQCNWKIFWENFMECYHCPGVHPDLCKVVPMYGKGFTERDDLPKNSGLYRDTEHSLLTTGAVTWSADGLTPLPMFDGLTPDQQAVGMTFATLLPSVYFVAHVDYLRSVRVLPLGPEETQLTVSWFLHAETLENSKIDVQRLIGFGSQVVEEDGRVCESNQKGIHSLRHKEGVLVPQEYEVLDFNNWVRERLGRANGEAGRD